MISPVDFIPVAEDIGLIVALGEWVLREACTEAVKWPADVKVAVNLSPVQFRSRNLVQVVISALAHSGLSPFRLELEITESIFLAETEANLAILHQLRELGVSISMDDFGTGYSKLSVRQDQDRSLIREGSGGAFRLRCHRAGDLRPWPQSQHHHDRRRRRNHRPARLAARRRLQRGAGLPVQRGETRRRDRTIAAPVWPPRIGGGVRVVEADREPSCPDLIRGIHPSSQKFFERWIAGSADKFT